MLRVVRCGLTGCCPNLTLVAKPSQDIFFGIRLNCIVAVKGKMFGISPDRHTWMLELSCETFVNGPCDIC